MNKALGGMQTEDNAGHHNAGQLLPLILVILVTSLYVFSSPTVAELNPQALAAQIELGRQLFFDNGLSADGRVSCASCHQPDKAFSDGRPVAMGMRSGMPNLPSWVVFWSPEIPRRSVNSRRPVCVMWRVLRRTCTTVV